MEGLQSHDRHIPAGLLRHAAEQLHQRAGRSRCSWKDAANSCRFNRDPTTGNWTAGTPANTRTPRFTQTDLSVFQDFHVSKSNERLIARIGGDCINCFNQHSVTIINSNIINTGSIKPYQCGSAGVTCSTVTDQQAGFNYASLLKGYDYIGVANAAGSTVNSQYGQA